jgi:hypothetical protein
MGNQTRARLVHYSFGDRAFPENVYASPNYKKLVTVLIHRAKTSVYLNQVNKRTPRDAETSGEVAQKKGTSMSTLSVEQNLKSVKIIRNPEKWIGKRTPKNYDDSAMQLDYCTCDHCRRWYKWDDLHNLLYPVSSYDTWLQKQLHIEEAEGYCPECLTRLECEAEKIDADWLAHHYRGMDESDRKAPVIVYENPYATSRKPSSGPAASWKCYYHPKTSIYSITLAQVAREAGLRS